MTFRSKHEYIQHEIKKMIKDNNMQPGDRLPTEHELVAKYEVSRHTVRTALNKLEHEGYIYKEQGSGSFVSEPSRKNKPKEIGVITTYISDYIFPTIIRGIEKELTDRGYSMILTSTNNDIELEKRAIDMMMGRNVDGLIIEPTKSGYYNPNIGRYVNLKEKGVPMIMINAKYEELELPVVALNDYKAGYDNTKFLIESGHTKIGGIFKIDDRQGKERLKGFIQACYEYGINYNSENVLVFETDNLFEVLHQQADKVVKNKQVTGFVCYNDKVAIELLNIIWRHGFSVPEDFSIVSHDNSILSSMTEVALTGVNHPKSELGKVAATLILDYIEGKTSSLESKLFNGEFIKKNSVKLID